jgi:ABC-type amino acid transport substrate-binding protein
MVFDISTNYDYALGLRKANNETLIVFNNQLQGMKKDGTLSQLFEKYGIGRM